MACSHKLNIVTVDAEDLEQKTSHSDPAKFHKAWHQVYTAHGLLVPGGFGMRGAEGIIAAIRSARENGTPFLGICLGMQLAVVEYARNVCGMANATSEEFQREKDQERSRKPSQGPSLNGVEDSTPNVNGKDYVIVNMEDLNRENMGGTMRLGLQETHFQTGSEWSKMRAMYENDKWKPTTHKSAIDSISNLSLTNGTHSLANGKSSSTSLNSVFTNGTGAATPHPPASNPKSAPHTPLVINERHRHAYEVNPTIINKLTSQKYSPAAAQVSSTITTESPIALQLYPHPAREPYELHFVGKDAEGLRMEVLELKHHPWFVGVQFHPEYLSRVLKPSKPYLGFVAAAAKVLGDVVGEKGR